MISNQALIEVSFFFAIWLIRYALISHLDSIPTCYNISIVTHISTKHRLTTCFLYCAVGGAWYSQCSRLEIMIKWSIRLLSSNYCFSNQFSWAYRFQLCALPQWLIRNIPHVQSLISFYLFRLSTRYFRKVSWMSQIIVD